jgi:hypothetical protein
MNTIKSVAWTTPSKYGIPSRSLTRIMTPHDYQDGTSGRRDGEVRHDKRRGANSNVEQAQDPGEQNSKLWKYKMDGSRRCPTNAKVIYRH